MSSTLLPLAINKPKVIYIDLAYTLKIVTDRNLEQEFTSRECNGYFEHVWGVHPIADLPEKRKLNYSGFKISQTNFSESQTIIEGLSCYYGALKNFFALNFLVSQIRFISYLIKLVKKEKIDLIISTDPYFPGLIGLIIKLFTKAKLAIWIVGQYDEMFSTNGFIAYPKLFRRKWIEKFFGKIVLKSSDLVIGGNQNCLDFGLNNGAKINKSTIFPVGKLIYKDHLVPKDQRDLNEIFAHSTAKYHFIYVGRMLDVKFSEDVLLAFEIMYKANSECALIMAGDGDMKKELENRSLEMKISDRVFFLGNVSQKNLCNILAGCFAGFSPLTGRSLIEVSLASLPIVAYEQDWHRDFITRRGAGILVPFRNWQAMAQAALELIDKPEETKKLAEASRLTGLDFCDTDKLYVHEQNEFNKLLKK